MTAAMARALSFVLRRWPLFAALASAAMLASAHGFQRMGYAPCYLCLKQREVYWAALAVAVVGIALQVSRPVIGRWPSKFAIVGLGLIFLFGAGLAGFHAGVEWDWWEGPATCASSGAGRLTLESMNAALERGVRAPMCDEAPWYVLGLSMAGWNAVVSLVLAILSAMALRRREPSLG